MVFQVGAEFLARHYPVHTVLLPSPTWANHTKIFPLAGIADVRTYRYFRAASRDLDFQVICTPYLALPAARTSRMHHQIL